MKKLEFARDIIAYDAAIMDAVEFQQFLEDLDISHEWNEVTVYDFNDGIYDVYLIDIDMPVRFINGVFVPEED